MKTNKLRTFAVRTWLICIPISLLFACSQQGNSQREQTSLKILAANGYQIALDTMPPLETLPIGKMETIPLGKPTESPIPSYTKPIEWKTTKAGNPKVYTLGLDSVPFPKSVPAIHQPLRAGSPQINVAKQFYSKDYNPFNLRIFGLNEGLIESQVHNLFQDKKGNIWLGTFNGISKYNGHTFENYTRKEGLVDNFYQCGLEDQEGNIWLGFRGGVTKYDGVNFTNYTTNEGLSNNNIESIIEDRKGNIWFATLGGGVTMFTPKNNTFTHFGMKQGMPPNVLSILEDTKGNLWFTTQDYGLVKYDSKSFSRFSYYEGLTYNTIIDVKEDHSGNIWLAMWTGVTRFDGNNFYHLTGNQNSYASKISIDMKGDIWFGAMPGGVYKIDKTFATITSITSNEGLPDNQVISSMIDINDNLWFGTGNGVVKHSKMVNNLSKKDGLVGFQVNCVLKDKKQNIWVGTHAGGISKIDFEANKIKNYTPKEGLSNENITSMLQDKAGNIWCGTQDFNMFRLNADGKTLTHFRDSGSYVVCIFEDKDGNIWYSSRQKGEVLRINKKDSTVTHFTTKQGLPHSQVIRIWQDSGGNIWFCTFNGVSRLDKNGKQLTNFTEKEGMKLSIVESVFEDKYGNFWFSNLADGITHLNYKNKTFIHFTEKDGLSNNSAFGILNDKVGNLWFNTRNGLSKLSSDVLQQLASKEPLSKPIYFKNYTAEQGYLGFGGGRFDIVEDSTGRIWIPMTDRLTIFDPSQELIKKEKPVMQLTNIKLFNEPITWKKDTSFVLKNGLEVGDFHFEGLSQWYNLPEKLQLAYNNSYLNFEFVGINTNTPQKLIYQYTLEGLEKTWSVPSARSEASYGNLPTGNYVFKVKGMNSDGNWSEIYSYQFSIRPPFWKTWWAYLIYILCIGYTIYRLINYRVEQGINRIRALEAIRTKISVDLHDDVGSVLSGLAMQSQMLAFSAKEEQKESLLEISSMSHDAMERMRDTVWAIDSRKDKYENLIDRMRAFAEKNLNMKQIKHIFKVEVEDSKKFINPEKRQNVYLILKEAIINICKHSDAKNVTIVFRQEKNSLYLLIHDDGSKKNTINSDGLGLNNMKMRAKNIGATLNIFYENGFSVELSID
ncbi:ligand-binding sensor domain-containing protein [Emticicia sp. SJ17W-69]|uniref:ligand-binding sensor domain-containing protein n=1 Tax=Emticicia sp. SJ17W-69 TaxID=3421657 RepID=UPI003EBA9CFB